MNDTRNQVALIVHSCDRYQLLYTGFYHFFAKYWDFRIPCTCYFVTEEIDVSFEGFVNIKTGKGEWADRLKVALNDIPEKYVLYFQEDMWLTRKSNADFFSELFTWFCTNNKSLVKLHSADIYRTYSTDLYITGLNVARLNNAASKYLMSHQVSLWDKSFLIHQLRPNEHPWRNERRATKRFRAIDPEIYHIDYFAENGHTSINQNSDNSVRSGYACVSFNGTLNDRSLTFIQELKSCPNTELVKYGQLLEYHHQFGLTHDGLSKPRKDGIFKKIKNLFVR
jgi:hypothetical protein